MTETKKVRIICGGALHGQIAYVTWSDEEYLRVTPLRGDPLDSFELTWADVEEISNGDEHRSS